METETARQTQRRETERERERKEETQRKRERGREGEAYLVLHSLYVEPYRGDGCHNLAQLEFVQDRRLPGGVKANHHNAALGLKGGEREREREREISQRERGEKDTDTERERGEETHTLPNIRSQIEEMDRPILFFPFLRFRVQRSAGCGCTRAAHGETGSHGGSGVKGERRGYESTSGGSCGHPQTKQLLASPRPIRNPLRVSVALSLLLSPP